MTSDDDKPILEYRTSQTADRGRWSADASAWCWFISLLCFLGFGVTPRTFIGFNAQLAVLALGVASATIGVVIGIMRAADPNLSARATHWAMLLIFFNVCAVVVLAILMLDTMLSG
jgi:hypothetical protein